MDCGKISDIGVQEVTSNKTGEIFTTARLITEIVGVVSFSVTYEELSPGHRSSSPHCHSKNDEMYIVLSGTPTVQVNNEERIVRSGCYVSFRGGSNEKHVLINSTNQKVKLLKINSCLKDDIVTY